MFDLMPFGRDERRFLNAFGEFGRDFFREMDHSLVECKTDILDQGNQYLLRAELPGFAKEDIHIDIEGDCLTLQAEHKTEASQEQDQYIRRERSYGAYARRFDLSEIQSDKITAAYQNGVLELTLPKKAEVQPVKRNISIL